jgi:molecular chaperone DnaK
MGSIKVGIDLGTTNTVVAIYEQGSFEYIRFRKNETLSSVMLYQNGVVTIGNSAKTKSQIYPSNYIKSSKTYMGDMTKSWKIEDKIFSPTDVAIEILKECYSQIKSKYNSTDIEAVITVPAYFKSTQIDETKKAGEKAGFKVRQIITEPVAAAVAYGFETKINEKIFIVDVGGGTFDTSILQVSSGKFQTLAIDGDNRLGGDDFDNHIIEYILKHIRINKGINLASQEKSGLSETEYKRAYQAIINRAEDIKIELSNSETSSIEISNLFSGYNLSTSLTKSEFEKISQPTLKKIENIISRTVETAIKHIKGFDLKQIDRVVLVGGTSKIPAIQNFVSNFFNKKPFSDKPLDKLVAMGAALTINSGDTIQIIDLISHSLGIELVNDEFSPILNKDQEYPIAFTKRYTTVSNNQKSIDLEIFEGEDQNVNKNSYYGGFSLSNIENARAGIPQIDVTFEFDKSRILHVTAKDVRTGSSLTKQIIIEKGAVKREKKVYEKAFDIALIIDVSGSMCGDPINRAKDACRLLVSNMIDLNTHRIGFVDFGSVASIRSYLTNSQVTLNSAINNMVCGGGTNMVSGINVAKNVLNGAINDKLAILITDGHPDSQSTAEYEGQYLKYDTTFITIGIGNGVDENFLKRLATSSNYYYSGSDFSQLSSIFQKISNSLKNI